MQGYQLSILLVEDNAVTRFLVSQVMEMWGHAVVRTENGRQAVEAAQEQKFDVILMDMQMPIMSGVEAVQIIRHGGGPSAATPIIAFTADAIPENRAGYIAAGCDTVVTKPIEWDFLAREIKYAVERSKSAPSFIPEAFTAEDSIRLDSKLEDGFECPILDVRAIAALQDGVGPVLMKELLEQCLVALEFYLTEVKSAADEADLINVRRAAHDLKSVCSQFGIMRAGAIARMIEGGPN